MTGDESGEVAMWGLDDAIRASLTPTLLRSAVPLLQVVRQPEEPPLGYVVGTGTLWRIAGRLFLVTAAHVLRDHPDAELVVSPDGLTSTTLRGARLLATPAAHDLGVVCLEAAIAERLDWKLPLQPTQLVGEQPVGSSKVILVGWPTAPTPPMLAHDGGFKEGQRSPAEPWSPRPPSLIESVLLDDSNAPDAAGLEPDAIFQPHAEFLANFSTHGRAVSRGRVEQLPLPHGMSGCSVWAWMGFPDAASGVWSAERSVAVLGIQRGMFWKPKPMLRVTCWPIVARYIRHYWPDTAPELDAAYGGPPDEAL